MVFSIESSRGLNPETVFLLPWLKADSMEVCLCIHPSHLLLHAFPNHNYASVIFLHAESSHFDRNLSWSCEFAEILLM